MLHEFIPAPELVLFEPVIEEIQHLKRKRGALILAHNYQTPEIFHGVADERGDSLALARKAEQSDADVIVVCGVHFMAETVKLLCPHKVVLCPDMEAGCSLAASIAAEDVRDLRRLYPGVPIVCYVNTTAAVKAECDVCCTSANVVKVVKSLRVPRVIVLPDEYLASYVAAHTDVEIISWPGHCEVHERFTARQVTEYRVASGAYVLAHPECPRDVQLAADFVGSTAGMIEELATQRPERALLLTECSMSDNVAVLYPDIRFERPCNLCQHMKRITLGKIRDCLQQLAPEVHLDPGLASRARRAVTRMLEVR